MRHESGTQQKWFRKNAHMIVLLCFFLGGGFSSSDRSPHHIAAMQNIAAMHITITDFAHHNLNAISGPPLPPPPPPKKKIAKPIFCVRKSGFTEFGGVCPISESHWHRKMAIALAIAIAESRCTKRTTQVPPCIL